MASANSRASQAWLSAPACGSWGLSYAVSLGHRQFSEKTLLRMERFSGLALLLLAVAHGAHIIWRMAHHRI